ncbi:hypothetical protein A7A08_01594 [Methyloligella halotolerans]|uniref:Uncharacterized protein n=1 Tax=Methyloligella halotolerans TaxID=1177755 RepID=A0A1E2RZH4_9HYPH|nr:hypothetical protein [Methyloligella halotolerans]ODA67560.1 hypothetical protein A7A08_01594 [Methyloligella halotolerans]
MSRQAETSAIKSQAKPKRPILALSGLCNDAADHVARARVALFDETADTETAMNQLDDAITLLKSVVAASKSVLKENEAALKKTA